MPHRRPKTSFVLGAVAVLAVASPFAVYGLTESTPDVRSANESSSVVAPTQISEILLASVPNIIIPIKELTGLDLPDINLSDLKSLIPKDLQLPAGITIPTELLPAPAAPGAVTETPVQSEEVPGAVVKQLTRDTPFSMVALTSDTVDSAKSKIRALSEDGIWGPWFTPDAIDSASSDQATNSGSATEPVYVGLTKAIQILTPPSAPAPVAELAPAAAPVAEAPVAEAPVAEAPVAEAPVAEAPVAEGELGYTPASVSKPLHQVETTADAVTAVLIDPSARGADANLQTVAAPIATGGPAVITRAQWGADESKRCQNATYDDGLGGATVHHTAGNNNYSKAESAEIVRGIYAYHAQTLGWCDVGYNVLVDKYGQIFEGRAGGLDRPVQGAHAGGFNENTTGIAMMGDYSTVQPSQAMLNSVGQFLGWKLKKAGLNPLGTTVMYSEGTEFTQYPQGAAVTLPIIFAHRDVGYTECPGNAAYSHMGEIRQIAAAAANGAGPSNPSPGGSNPPPNPNPNPKPQTPADTVAGGTGSVNDLVNQVIKMTDSSPLVQKWIAEGGDLGRLGEAITGELQAKFGNLGALFQNGAIYTSPNGGVYTVLGEIFKAWQSFGSDSGVLGLPISDEYLIPDGFRSDFENGSLIFNQVTGIVTQIMKAVG